VLERHVHEGRLHDSESTSPAEAPSKELGHVRPRLDGHYSQQVGLQQRLSELPRTCSDLEHPVTWSKIRLGADEVNPGGSEPEPAAS
jgi:hypothetical protein